MVNTPHETPVVVGVDDSRLSMTAVRLAAREAALHSRPLRIVHAFNWVANPSEPMPEEPRKPAEELLDRSIRTATGVQPQLTATSALIEGPVITTLLRESGSAALLVIGDGGLTVNPDVPADSEATAVQIAARAGCSVLVARETFPSTGPVVVGVDGSASSLGALDFAFDTAARHATDLVVVQVWDPDETTGDLPAEAVGQLAEAVAPWQRKYPSVSVSQQARIGDPEAALMKEASRAEVVVVSARGDEPWRGMLGAVSQAMLYHSPAPVIVVRGSHGLYIQE
ncbi:universal stress protein [Plantactinospora soyae]|uniref:Nucleotide-binding universal stress UspA family protein n=1 Tax=Plantactinospora soyae TaxID=1544732 RepID=A0A927M5W7_9ACTN|nr:universal stress protein [Plantactinospora soyae]MBE1488574.1 nucleotide-binding universal stress UspA family protein [Plantactinospora soyae]